MTPPPRRAARSRRHLPASLGAMLVAAVAVLLGAGCAITVPRQGTSGSVAWELADDQVTLRETAGIGIQFTTLRYAVPLPPAGYYRSSGEEPVRGRLEPHGVLRVPIPRAATEGKAEYEFRGVDDNGRPVSVLVQVEFKDVP